MAVLLVSELVSNAVRHGTPPVTVETECDSSHALAVRVSDASSALPLSNGGVPDDAETGRGLAILQILSDAWGVDPHRNGKTVWFRITPHDEGGGVASGTAELPRHERLDLRDTASDMMNARSSGEPPYPTA